MYSVTSSSWSSGRAAHSYCSQIPRGEGLQGFRIDHEGVGEHLRRDVEGGDDDLAAHGQPLVLLGLAEEGKPLVDAAQGGRAGHHRELAAHTICQAPLGELAGEGCGMDHGQVFPAPVAVLCHLAGDRAVAEEEVVEVHQDRGIVEDDRQGHPVEGVTSDFSEQGHVGSGPRCSGLGQE